MIANRLETQIVDQSRGEVVGIALRHISLQPTRQSGHGELGIMGQDEFKLDWMNRIDGMVLRYSVILMELEEHFLRRLP
jgi:hypothetical protein